LAFKIYIPQKIDQSGIAYLEERGYQIVTGSGLEPEQVKKDIADCDGMILRMINLNRDIINQAKKLKIIARYGAGYNNVDLEAARAAGIYVTYSPSSNIITVAEHTLGLIIASGRFFRMGDVATRTGNFAFRHNAVGCDFAGKTLGILGMGNIGAAVARKAMLGLDMKIIGYVRDVTKDYGVPGVELTDDWDYVFRTADFISIHLPVTPETMNIVGSREFEMMKGTAHFINCSRGELVDEQALITALKEGQIAGAGIDVYSPEPPAPDNELLKLDNVMLSPHNAGTTREAAQRVALESAMAVDDVLNGRRPVNALVIP